MMERLVDLLRGFRPVTGDRLRIVGSEAEPIVALDPQSLCIEAAPGASARVIVAHSVAGTASVRVDLCEGAQLEVIELFLSEARFEVAAVQAARSRCRVVSVLLAGAQASCAVDLNGAEAEHRADGVFLIGGQERCALNLRVAHNVADCRSDSGVRGVAGGEAVGEFFGRVYVAPDAQRTDARQQSRGILLSDAARIATMPQLEIYADDVKCSHGATVGQMDAEAVLYMRQRGLSEALARRLQIEGFVGDVVRRCGPEPLCEELMRRIAAKLEQIQR